MSFVKSFYVPDVCEKKNRTALFYCPKTGVNRERRQLKYLPLQKENLGY